jgi:hypothetical protein
MEAVTRSNVPTRLTDRNRAMCLSLALAAAAFVVAGCAAISSATPRSLPPGATEADVLATMGKPTGRYTFTEGGYRLEFARGPQGRETWMIDFDAAGRMVDSEQVMDLWYLSRIMPGLDAQDVLARVGHPGSIRPIPRQELSLWNYRYPTHDCLWYQITVGDDGKVIAGGTGIDPQCDPGGSRAGSMR